PMTWRLVLEPFLASVERLAAQEAAKPTTAQTSAGDGFTPIQIESVAMGTNAGKPNAYAISFPQGIVWGLMGCAASFGISIVVERTRGTLTRLQVSPIPRGQILLGKGLSCFVTCLGVATGLLILAWLFFDVRPHSITLLAAAVVCCAAAFV